jgi:chorismate mutase/prephenate dehydratase
MSAAKMVAEYKQEHGLEIYDQKREEDVVRINSAYVEDEKVRAYYVNFLKNTMQVSRSYQSELMSGMRVAYSGTEGAFAHIATCKLFPTARKLAFSNFESAYKAVEDGECDVAVLPVENSYNGEVGQVTDLLFSGSLYVNGVFDLAVSHNLLGTKDSSLDDVKQVVSHSQALGQCAGYIKEKGFEGIEYVNTALAAKFVAEKGDKTISAIASVEAAEIFGLKVLDHNINSSRTNTTKFLIVSRSESKHSLKEMGVHTILLFTVRNQAGALAKAIEIIGKHGFNMRTLRSRPMKELLWQYYFYIEAEGNINTEEGAVMMKELSQYCDRLKSVGTYIKKS